MSVVVRFGSVLALIVFCSSNAYSQTEIRGDGVVFPDGTIQTTAASSVATWPQQCQATISASEEYYPTCYMYGGSDPTWNGTNGVPAGYFFLVTDVLITPNTTLDSGEVTIRIYHISGCDNGIAGGTGLARLTVFRTVPDTQSFSSHFQSPPIVLPEGSCLRFDGYSSNSFDAEVSVSGYLTTDPSKFR